MAPPTEGSALAGAGRAGRGSASSPTLQVHCCSFALRILTDIANGTVIRSRHHHHRHHHHHHHHPPVVQAGFGSGPVGHQQMADMRKAVQHVRAERLQVGVDETVISLTLSLHHY